MHGKVAVKPVRISLDHDYYNILVLTFQQRDKFICVMLTLKSKDVILLQEGKVGYILQC